MSLRLNFPVRYVKKHCTVYEKRVWNRSSPGFLADHLDGPCLCIEHHVLSAIVTNLDVSTLPYTIQVWLSSQCHRSEGLCTVHAFIVGQSYLSHVWLELSASANNKCIGGVNVARAPRAIGDAINVLLISSNMYSRIKISQRRCLRFKAIFHRSIHSNSGPEARYARQMGQ